METPDETVPFAELALFLVKLARERAFGDVTVQLQRGQITLVRFEQTFRPGNMPCGSRQKLNDVVTVLAAR